MHALCGLHHAKDQPMSTFTGTDADETITPEKVSPTVTANGQPRPSADADTINAGGGNDIVAGGGGNDVANLGSGDDTFIWNPGDGSDTVDGQAGFDTLVFAGSSADEKFNISANGQHVQLTRDVGNVTMDLNSMERHRWPGCCGRFGTWQQRRRERPCGTDHDRPCRQGRPACHQHGGRQ
jgi:Ca2+-binding RTX toxin-like protein